MPVPHNFSRKLHEVLGSEVADSMVDWMNRSDENYSELRRELAEFRQTVRADFAELRQEMNAKFADVQQEMRVGFAQVDAKFAAAEAGAARRHADFMKWTLGFWAASLVTLVGAIAGFATILR